VRVVGGVLGGRRLVAPPVGTRPTSDLVRGALFAALEARRAAAGAPGLVGLCVLDLYAGSGALGIEALSRGCREAWFVEAAAPALAALRANLSSLGLQSRARVIRGRVERVLASRLLDCGHFDLVLADPPYAQGVSTLLQRLGNDPPPWLGPETLCALEHAVREELPAASGTLRRVWHRTYGGTALSLYVHRDARGWGPAPERRGDDGP
jgi:16S rRNA (guanine966-N2)-methyltransferase